MITLKVYEINKGELPVEGADILYFDSQDSYGMFEENYTKEGVAKYQYDGLGDYATLEDALKDHKILWDNKDNIDDIYDYNTGDPKCILLEVDSVNLDFDTKWMYMHEYYPQIGEVTFTFQTLSSFNIALREGWIYIVDERVENVTLRNDTSDAKYTHWKYQTVMFGERKFNVIWIDPGYRGYYFHNYEEVK